MLFSEQSLAAMSSLTVKAIPRTTETISRDASHMVVFNKAWCFFLWQSDRDVLYIRSGQYLIVIHCNVERVVYFGFG